MVAVLLLWSLHLWFGVNLLERADRISRRPDTTVIQIGAPIHARTGQLRLVTQIGPEVPEGEFLTITDAAVGRDGRLIVADEKTPIVRLFAPTGKFLRTIGGKGRGPGEYLLPRGVAILE